MPMSEGGHDFVPVGGPFEGFRLGIVVIEEAIDGGLKVGRQLEDAAFEPSLGEGCEEAFDSVEP